MDSDVASLAGALVAIDSVNPSLVPGGAGEAEIADHVERWARAEGLGVERFERTAGRPSVVVRAAGSGDGRSLLLCGHLDTVGVEGMTDPFGARVADGRLHGRGSYDMKAGLAAALIAARDAARLGLRGDVIVAAVADEEHASLGVQEVLEHMTADAAVVTEPTELAIAVAHEGFLWSEIEIRGRAAHGSRPHLGVDAIAKAGGVLRELDRWDAELATRSHPLLGRPSAHAGAIEGGGEMSSYPGRCVLGVERRTLPGEDAATVEREVEALLARARADDPALDASQRTLLVREPFALDPGHELVSLVTAATTEALGAAAPVGGVSYWADSAFIAAAGIPTVLFGPGGEGAHATEEHVRLDDADAVARTLLALARSFCA